MSSQGSLRILSAFSLSPSELSHYSHRFSMAEEIVATRVSLIRSHSRSVQRDQIGSMDSSSVSSLLDSEARCLVNLSANARRANLPQVAFSGVLRAQQMVKSDNFHVSKEFAEALWTQKEDTMAIRLLEELIHKKDPMENSTNQDAESIRQWALLYARLVGWSTCHWYLLTLLLGILEFCSMFCASSRYSHPFL